MATGNVNDLKRRCEALGLRVFFLFGNGGEKICSANAENGRMVEVNVDHETADDVLADDLDRRSLEADERLSYAISCMPLLVQEWPR